MMWSFGPWMGWGMILWPIGMLLIIALVVWGVRRGGCCGPVTSPSDRNATDIAKERYAKGEISKEQFEQIKKDIA